MSRHDVRPRRTARTRPASRRAAVGRVGRAHRGPLAAVAAVTFAAALLGVLVVPVLAALGTAGTQHDLGRATAAERDLQVRYTATEPYGPDPQGALTGVGDSLADARAGMPALLRSVTGPGEYYAQTDPLQLDAEPSAPPAFVSLTADPGFAGRTHVTSGRAPRAADSERRIEVVVSPAVAEAIGWRVGTSRTVTDTGVAVELVLVGLYAADDPGADAWEQTPATLRPAAVPFGPGGTAASGVAYTATDSFAAVARTRVTTGRGWFPLRTDAVSAGDRTEIATQVRQVLAGTTPLPSTVTTAARITTGLPDLLDASAARDASVGTLAAALGSGPLVAVVGVLVLLARITVDRDRERWRLLAARGADRRLRSTLAAGLVGAAAVPAAVLGAATAWAVATLTHVLPQDTAAAATTAAATAAVCALLPCALATLVVPGRDRRVGTLRLRGLLEGTVVVLTVVALVVTLRSGIATATPGGGVDPLAAVLPVLLAATVTVVAVRVLPTVLGAVVRRRRARATLPGFLGAVTAARTHGTRTVALAVAVAGFAVALFGSVVGSTLEDGLDQAARRSVGADVSVESTALDAERVTALSSVPGVGPAVGLSTSGSIDLTTPSGRVTASLVVADSARLATVQRGVPGAVPVPRALRGSDAGGVPILVSETLAAELPRVSEVGGTTVRVVGTVPDTSAFTLTKRWAFVDDRYADAITSTGSVDRVLARLRPGADADRVAAALERAGVDDGVAVRTTASVARQLTTDPRVPGVRAIALVAAGLGALVGAGALGLAGVLAGPGRRERGRLLRVLGLGSREDRRVVAAEAVPTLVAAFATALVAAALVVAVTLPAADLRSFTGSPVRPPVAVDPLLLAGTVAVVVGALFAVLGVEVAAGTVRGGGRRPGRSARHGRPPGTSDPAPRRRRADQHRDRDHPTRGRHRARPTANRPGKRDRP